MERKKGKRGGGIPLRSRGEGGFGTITIGGAGNTIHPFYFLTFETILLGHPATGFAKVTPKLAKPL